MSKEAFCLWHDKFIQDFSEHESENCMNDVFELCDACDAFCFKERHEE